MQENTNQENIGSSQTKFAELLQNGDENGLQYLSTELTPSVIDAVKTVDEWNTVTDRTYVLLPDTADEPYTKKTILDLCKGDSTVAFGLYSASESTGLCPETILDEDSREDVEDQCFPICHKVEVSAPKPKFR